jgi:hypothetical protein
MTAPTITLVVLAVLSGFGLTCRVVVGYFQERYRWKTVERMVDRHGADVIAALPTLARELRGHQWRPRTGRRR